MYFYITLIIGLILDITTKYIASSYITNKINLIGEYIYIDYILNPGIAFGINIPLLKIITIILIIGIFYYYLKEEKAKNNKYIDISFGLILSGAIGNGIERVFNGYVVDFIGVKYFSIFNIADSFITIGAILYIYTIYKITK